MLDVDTEVIKRAQQGDVKVLSELYEKYHTSIFRYIYYRVGDQQAAEDLTSEVFERMLRFIGGFQPPSVTFTSWLFQIARNLSTDHFRRNGGRKHVQLEEHMRDIGNEPDKAIEHTLTGETLQRALSRLSEDQRDVIILRFIAEMPIAETARALSKSEDAIKGLQRRALISLRQTLNDWEVTYDTA
jgi:RNA polymerase sigma-70 factor, ECF subfamily